MNKNGFTIIELTVVISVSAILMLVVSNLLVSVFSGSNQSILALSNIDQSTIVVKKFINEIRNATNGADGSFPLYLADNNQIIFYSNIPESQSPARIRYYFSNATLYRGVVMAQGSPLSYNLTSEVIRPVQKDVVNGSLPIFSYFDGNYNGVGDSLIQPVNINNIKYIKMTLKILKQNQVNSDATFSVSAGGVIRNLKNNLGN